MSVTQMMPLPQNTPWGNLGLKSLKIVQRIEHINRRIRQAYQSFEETHRIKAVAHDFESLEVEEVIYWIRKSVDEFVQLLYVAEQFHAKGSYPARIEIDCIGELLKRSDSDLYRMFNRHHAKLRQLNEVGNAYKHSFLGSELSLVGRDEPVVFSLSAPRNDLANPVQFNSIRLADFVQHFDELYQFVRGECVRLLLGPNGEQRAPTSSSVAAPSGNSGGNAGSKSVS